MLPAPSLDELVAIGLAAANQAREVLLLDEGDIAEQDHVSSAAMGVAVLNYGIRLNRQTYLEGCTGEELDQRILDRYNLQRLDPASATVPVKITRASAAAGAGTIAAGAVFATEPDSEGKRQEFTTDAPLSWGALETGTKTVAATASTQGSDGNVAIGTITKVVTTLFDTTFTVTNDERAAGGADEEEDGEYIARARQYPQTLARATKAAVEFGAKQIAGVRIATAQENPVTGLSRLYIADASGNSNNALVNRVIVGLEDWRALGAAIQVTGGIRLEQAIAVALTLKFGTAADLDAVVQAAITDELAKLGGGETLYIDQIKKAVINAAPDRVLKVAVTPAEDVDPEDNEIIRAGTITVS